LFIQPTIWKAFHGVVDAFLIGNNLTQTGKVVITRWFTTSPNDRSSNMSARNGDKSRYHRERKQKIARRQRTRELRKRGFAERKSSVDVLAHKPRSVSA
jgi:hypothetical protein